MLTDARVVMIWRRVSSLSRPKYFVQGMMNWNEVGQDEFSIMYDAGGAIVGFAEQVKQSAEEMVNSEERIDVQGHSQIDRQLADDCCSIVSLMKIDLVVNPASELVVAAGDVPGSLRRLETSMSLTGAATARPVDGTVPFVDFDGNVFSLLHNTNGGLRGSGGQKVSKLLTTRGIGERAPAHERGATPLVALRLSSGNVRRSSAFYRNTLGLKRLEGGLGEGDRDEVMFDLGTTVLGIRSEPINGMVRSIEKSGRLTEDWAVFHVKDITKAVAELGERGVTFPLGIETSRIGRVAMFKDPDGHALSLWEPSGKPSNINFYPTLERILNEAA